MDNIHTAWEPGSRNYTTGLIVSQRLFTVSVLSGISAVYTHATSPGKPNSNEEKNSNPIAETVYCGKCANVGGCFFIWETEAFSQQYTSFNICYNIFRVFIPEQTLMYLKQIPFDSAP